MSNVDRGLVPGRSPSGHGGGVMKAEAVRQEICQQQQRPYLPSCPRERDLMVSQQQAQY